MRRYFAYGSNIDTEQMKKRCPQLVKIGKANLSGFEFYINRRGVASIRQQEGKMVWGIIYDISGEDEISLDKYEGYPNVYKKEDLRELNAFCYIDPITEIGSPRDGYLEKIIEAAQVNNFPKGYIIELQSWLKK